ncbi:putative internalin [Histomonas meleagridis]|uniref:putative internalin n=1 Tax=Histomonas meleagridis TaxID=135588 RepID=UPI00355A4201|nr:putative internalin [Histomonas meleagridis]KAH0803646.1 putative internalin [Histomonas meleagridis]
MRLEKIKKELELNLNPIKNLSKQQLSDMKFLQFCNETKLLIATFNNFVDFTNFSSHAKIEEFDFSDCKIENFNGAKIAPHMHAITLKNCPITSYVYYRIVTYVVFGPTLRFIDGKPITLSEKKLAKQINSKIIPFIRIGYLPDRLNIQESEIPEIQNRVIKKRYRSAPPSDNNKSEELPQQTVSLSEYLKKKIEEQNMQINELENE